jgi:hypothetical protein
MEPPDELLAGRHKSATAQAHCDKVLQPHAMSLCLRKAADTQKPTPASDQHSLQLHHAVCRPAWMKTSVLCPGL